MPGPYMKFLIEIEPNYKDLNGEVAEYRAEIVSLGGRHFTSGTTAAGKTITSTLRNLATKLVEEDRRREMIDSIDYEEDD